MNPSRVMLAAAALAALHGCADPRREAPALCGNGILDDGELCDGTDFGGLDCRDFEAFRGQLRCATDCRAIETDGCSFVDGASEVDGWCGNGILDEGEDCDTRAPTVDCAAIGEGRGVLGCTVECRFDLSACCQMTGESCNGADDDCDGLIDEQTCDGETYCIAGACQGCEAEAEACNGSDDDCDGLTDEDFGVGRPCEVGRGACVTPGVIVCDGDDVACSARPPAPVDESCNGDDDDCDGRTDEGVLCDDAQACREGRCEAVCRARAERCDGGDDDCDGQVDEGGGLCDAGEVCAEGGCVIAICAPGRLTPFAGSGTLRAMTGASSVRGSCGGAGPEVGFTLSPRADSIVCVDTQGSAIDTVLHVRSDCDDPATEIACNDDALGYQSQVEFLAHPGVRYAVFVDSFGAAGGDVTLNVSDGRCPPPCVPEDRCQPGDPAYVAPSPQQRVDHPAGGVLRLEIADAADCDRLRFRLSKTDGSALGAATYHLRVGTCKPAGVIRASRRIDGPSGFIDFTTDFRDGAGEPKLFCATRAADIEPVMGDHEAWWFSNLARVERVVRRCP